MKILHTLIGFLFLSALQDEKHTGVVDATSVYTGTTGRDVTVNCFKSRPDVSKFFCKQKCEDKDILIRATAAAAQRGRFSIQWKSEGGTATGDVSVTIRQLTKSDSGLYRCGFNQSGRSSLVDIRIIVVDALLDGNHTEDKHISARSGGNVVAACYLSYSLKWKYFCREECYRQNVLVDTSGHRVQKGRYSIEYVEGSSSGGILYVSISQLTASDSGRYRCRPDRLFLEDVYQEFTLTVTDDLTDFPSTSTVSDTFTGVVMYVRAAVIISIIMGLVLVIVCVQRSSKLKGSRPRGCSGEANMETSFHEIRQPASPCEDSDH